jgi:hypothetical protein
LVANACSSSVASNAPRSGGSSAAAFCHTEPECPTDVGGGTLTFFQ